MDSVVEFTEAHYCSLESQSNIYSIAKLDFPDGLHKVLIASLRGMVASTEFQNSRPVSREVQFTYIPGGAEIVAIDAFKKSHHGSGVVVGITFIKNADDKKNKYLNIYSECQAGSEFDLDRIAQGCQNLDIDFIPFHLTHTELWNNGSVETVFLLSGDDQRIHLFRAEDRNMHTFQEQIAEDWFPEFENLPSNVVWLSCTVVDDHRKRISAVGCISGDIRVSVVDATTNDILRQCSTQHDSPITTVQIYTHNTHIKCPAFVSEVLESLEEVGSDCADYDTEEFHLLVTSAAETAVVYRDIQEKKLCDPLLLPDSDHYDCVMCGCTIDLDFDGENEILIGTYGQELLAYKFYPKSSLSSASPSPHKSHPAGDKASDRGDDTSSKGSGGTSASVTSLSSNSLQAAKSSASADLSGGGEFRLLWRRTMPDPIFYVNGIDITGDGLKEVLVLSLKGMHILQYNLEAVASLAMDRLQQATQQQGAQDDIFKQLLSENLSSENVSETNSDTAQESM